MGAPYVTTQRLRYCDTDAMGHVNNAVYAVMLEAGRAEMMALAGMLAADGPHGVVIVRLELDFLAEMTWPGEVTIETAIVRLGGKSIQVRQRILLAGAVTARAATVLTVLDRATRRAVPLTEAWRATFSQWLVEDFDAAA